MYKYTTQKHRHTPAVSWRSFRPAAVQPPLTSVNSAVHSQYFIYVHLHICTYMFLFNPTNNSCVRRKNQPANTELY